MSMTILLGGHAFYVVANLWQVAVCHPSTRRSARAAEVGLPSQARPRQVASPRAPEPKLSHRLGGGFRRPWTAGVRARMERLIRSIRSKSRPTPQSESGRTRPTCRGQVALVRVVPAMLAAAAPQGGVASPPLMLLPYFCPLFVP